MLSSCVYNLTEKLSNPAFIIHFRHTDYDFPFSLHLYSCTIHLRILMMKRYRRAQKNHASSIVLQKVNQLWTMTPNGLPSNLSSAHKLKHAADIKMTENNIV